MDCIQGLGQVTYLVIYSRWLVASFLSAFTGLHMHINIPPPHISLQLQLLVNISKSYCLNFNSYSCLFSRKNQNTVMANRLTESSNSFWSALPLFQSPAAQWRWLRGVCVHKRRWYVDCGSLMLEMESFTSYTANDSKFSWQKACVIAAESYISRKASVLITVTGF